MPYRIDIPASGEDALDRLIDLGALDVESSPGGGVAAVMPDAVTPAQVARALDAGEISVSGAIGRDAGSVWVLRPRPTRIAGLWIVPAGAGAGAAADPATLHLVDSGAFGTGLHPTTALCLEALRDLIAGSAPAGVLDVGTGSGVLALAALKLGVADAVGLDTDDDALRAAGVNAQINGVSNRLRLARGGPESVAGTWPLVVANVLAAPLIEMAPHLVRRLGHHGHLVLSGIHASLAPEVEHIYRRLGLRPVRAATRGGWAALILQATW